VLTLVTGGARSGKSTFAERLAAAGRAPVIYVATARIGDDEMARRIAEHRARRPTDWNTIETPMAVGAALTTSRGGVGTVLLEDLTFLLANLLEGLIGTTEQASEVADPFDQTVALELDTLWEAQDRGGWDLIVVTNEVGWGIVPMEARTRLFRDALGRANQATAARADNVYLVVAGVPLRLKPPA
jgi:adenosylcobinamide kinase / adenosylcobinamide-phosphate guanylyltransferase